MGVLDKVVAGAVLPLVPKFVARKFAGRYVPGETLEDALAVVRKLNSLGMCATVDVLGVLVAVCGIVIGAHVEIDVEIFLRPLEDFRIVTRHAGGKPRFAYPFDRGRNLVKPVVRQKIVHHATMNVSRRRAALNGILDAAGYRLHFGACLGEPLDRAALVTVFR